MRLIECMWWVKKLARLDSSHYVTHSDYRAAYRRSGIARLQAKRFIKLNGIDLNADLIVETPELKITEDEVIYKGAEPITETIWWAFNCAVTKWYIERIFNDSNNTNAVV